MHLSNYTSTSMYSFMSGMYRQCQTMDTHKDRYVIEKGRRQGEEGGEREKREGRGVDTCNPRSARMKILQILTCHPILSLELRRFATKLFHNVHVQTSYYHTAVFTQQNGVVLINWQYSSSNNMGLWQVLIDIHVLVLHTHRFWNVVVSSVM